MNDSRISVVIPTLDEEACLARAIRSVAADAEVIVVDGCSCDRTREIAVSEGAKVLSCPASRGAQLRVGARCATGDWLLFLHADSWLETGWAEDVRELSRDAVGGAFCLAIEAPGRGYRLVEGLRDSSRRATKAVRNLTACESGEGHHGFVGLALLVAAVLFVAFANGANDNFKGVATLRGSGTLAYRPALAMATITTLAGSLAAAWLADGLVSRFTGKGLIADSIVASPTFLLAVAAGASGTVLLATRLGFPISTTHALTGALVGAGMVVAGPSHVAYGSLGRAFALPLLASPLLATAITAGLYAAFRQTRLALGVTHEDCICVGQRAPLAALTVEGRVVTVGGGPGVSIDRPERCERRYAGTVLGVRAQSALDGLHLLTAGTVGFARGLNDTPKILALLVGAGALGVHDGIGLVAVGMAAGGILAARRVAHTMAHGISGMNHGQAFTASLVTAGLVVAASPLGLPVSTTHVACGAIFGIGAVNGEARWSVIGQVLLAWITTLPAAMILAAGFALLMSAAR